jgi:hypothetical protein
LKQVEETLLKKKSSSLTLYGLWSSSGCPSFENIIPDFNDAVYQKKLNSLMKYLASIE